MQGHWVVFLWLYAGEYSGFWEELAFGDLGDVGLVVWAVQEGLGEVCVYSLGLPANLLSKPGHFLIQIAHINNPILLLLIIPIPTLLTNPPQYLNLLFTKRKIPILPIVRPIKLANLRDLIIE